MDVHSVVVTSGVEGLTLMLEEFKVYGRPKERDEVSYEFPRRPGYLSPCCSSILYSEKLTTTDYSLIATTKSHDRQKNFDLVFCFLLH